MASHLTPRFAVSAFPDLELQMAPPYLWLYVGSGEPNSSLHTYTVCALITETKNIYSEIIYTYIYLIIYMIIRIPAIF